MTITFITPGNIDLQAAFTFGMSAKVTDKPIGFFGTGLKYATATLLRTGHKVRIWTGGKWLEMTLEPTTYRDKEFSIVQLDGKPLGFTTELGKQWKFWQAFRELHSNTLDESGETVSNLTFDFRDDQTAIEVTGSGIDEAYRDRHTIFCSSPILADTPSVEIRSGMSENVFYRGIRVSPLRRTSDFTYNVKTEMTLTEDRTLSGEFHRDLWIREGVARLTDVDLLRRILAPVDKESYEAHIDYSNVDHPTPEFLEVVRESFQSQFLNNSARKVAVRVGKIHDSQERPLEPIQQKQLERAVDCLERMGFDVKRFPIRVVELYGPHGKAANGTIYISPQCFRRGTKYLASTIYEEFLHLSEGVLDETRQMQTMLFDQIMTMGEKLIGEPI